MLPEYPYTNFHDLNLDWLIQTLRSAVYKVNGTAPDSDGNVNLAGISGVTSVNGIGADGAGNISLTASDVSAVPVTDMNVSAVSQDSAVNLINGQCIIKYNAHVMQISMVAYIDTTINTYYTVNNVNRIPLFKFTGNPFNLPTRSITGLDQDLTNYIGPLEINNDWWDLNFTYDGANTIFYIAASTLTQLPAGSTVYNQCVNVY